MFNWNDLRHFLAVAREGSTGSAARALGVSQSTIHRRLVALEKGLGSLLVERHHEGYRLTPHGERLLGSAEKVEAAVHALQRQVASLGTKISGHVRVTCLVTIGHRIMKSGLLDRFQAKNPGITVELLMDQRILDLSKGEADIAVRGGNPGTGALISKKIAELPWGIYASRDYINRYGGPADPTDIQNCGVIDLIDELEHLPAARWIRSHAARAKIVARCANVPSVHLAVRSGTGIAPLPTVYATDDRELVCVLGPMPELNYPMFLVTHEDSRRLPRVNALFEFCLRELKPVLMGAGTKDNKLDNEHTASA